MPRETLAERSDNQIHMLSDGNIITVGAERFRCESIFQATCHWQRRLTECTTSSFRNVMKCDVVMHVIFFLANVVLSSSTTMLQEIGECMTKATDGVGSIPAVLARASFGNPSFLFPPWLSTQRMHLILFVGWTVMTHLTKFHTTENRRLPLVCFWTTS